MYISLEELIEAAQAEAHWAVESVRAGEVAAGNVRAKVAQVYADLAKIRQEEDRATHSTR